MYVTLYKYGKRFCALMCFTTTMFYYQNNSIIRVLGLFVDLEILTHKNVYSHEFSQMGPMNAV